MIRMAKVLGIFLSVLALLMVGCTGGSAPIGVALSLTTAQNVVAAQGVNLTATVSHDSKNAGVTWSLSPTTGAGSLSAQTATSVTYTAPALIASNGTATITATSVSDTTKTATLTINLQAVSITLTPNAAQTLEQGKTVSVTAAISNDPQTKGVTWSLNPASGSGTLTNSTTTSVTYNAPAIIIAASPVTLIATSVFDGTKTSMLAINLAPPPSVTTTSASLPAGTVGTAYTATNLSATGGVSPYTWTWAAQAGSQLPPGLSLSSAGAITGTPTAYGTFNFSAKVTDADGSTASASLSIKVSPAPVNITTTSLPNGVVNMVGYSATLTATGGATPITWSWAAQTGSSLPPGLSLSGAGVISGTPTTAGTFNVNVTATDSSTPALTATKGLSITIIPQLVITTSSLTNGIATHAYSSTLASSGGSGVVTWTLASGSNLPQGLTLNAGTGAISGTPTTSGNYSFAVQAADSGTPQQKVTRTLALTIYGVLSITPTTLPTGAVTSNYSASLFTNGGNPPITWSLASGTMPPGLNLTQAASMGIVSGTPTTAGTYTFTVQATDAGTPQQTATQQYTVTINPVLAITTTSLASGTVNTAYSQPVNSNNGGIAPRTWSISTGALPPGLNINTGTGVISGTPTTATGSPFNFTVHVVDSGTPQQTATSSSLSIAISTAPLSVATTGLPNGVVGQAYTGAQLQSAGGNPPVTWIWVAQTGSSLPPGLSLNAGTGAITGAPTSAGTFNVSVTATDATLPTHQTATKSLSITVVSALSITTASLPGGTVGSNYSTTVNATGGTTPYTWSWIAQSGSSLPPGLSINSSTGVISGTPTTNTGSPFNVTVSVADSETIPQVKTANFSITITVATLTVTTTSSQLPNGTVNSAYPNTNLSATGGIPSYSWGWVAQSGSQLPPGLSLNSSGQISGTPTTAGTFNVTATVTDSATPTANTANANLSITVNPANAACGTGSNSLLNGQYAFALQGFDASGPVAVGGTFNADGAGHVATLVGVEDINSTSVSGVQTNLSVNSASSSYSVGSDHRGCLTIATSAGTQTFRFTLGAISSGVASNGHIIQFDGTGSNTAGVLRKQDTTAFSNAQINGNYAFGVSGPKPGGGKLAAVGVLALSGGVVQSGSVFDSNDNGTIDSNGTTYPTNPASFTSGSYSISSNGRGTLQLLPSGSGSTTLHAAMYVVSAQEVLLLSYDAQTVNTLFVGSALQQSGGSFANSSLNATSVLYTTGLDNSTGTTASRVQAGLFTPSSGNFSFSGQQNGSGTLKAQSASGTYSVASNGRVTLAGGGGGAPLFYLVSANKGFALFTDGSSGTPHVSSGFFEPQTGGPFSISSANGTYAFGTIQPDETGVDDEAGFATFANPNVSGTSDKNSSGSLTAGQTFGPATYSVDSTGLGVIPAGCNIDGTTGTDGTCQTIFYIISPTKAVVFDAQGSTTTTHPHLQVAEK